MKFYKAFLDFITLLLFFWILLLWLSSCSATKKTVTKSTKEIKRTEKTFTDSFTIKTLDSTQVAKWNGSVWKKDDSSYERVIEEFEIDWIVPDTGRTDGGKVKLKERKKITWEKGVKKTESKLQVHVNDSTGVKKTDTDVQKKSTTVQLKEKATSNTKDKKVTRFSWWWLLLLLVIPIYRYRKKLIPFR